MKSVVLNIDELSDSRELMESKEPASIRWFIFIIFTAIVVAIIFAFYFEVDEYVKAPGEIKTMDIASNVTMTTGAKVNEVYVKEGERVKKGDILFALDVDYANQKLGIVQNQLDVLNSKHDNLVLLGKSIKRGENLFVGDNYNEEFYYRYEQYRNGSKLSEEQHKSSNQTKELTEEDNSNKLKTAKEKLKEKESLLSSYNYLKDCIQDGKSYDGNNDLVSAAYKDYALDLQKAQLAYDNAISAYKELYDRYKKQEGQVTVTADDVSRAKNEADTLATKITMTTTDFLSEIDEQISKLTVQSAITSETQDDGSNDNVEQELGDESTLSSTDEVSIIEQEAIDDTTVSSVDELLNEYQMLKRAIISGEEYVCSFEEVREKYSDYILIISELQSEYEIKLATYNDLLTDYEYQQTTHITQSDVDNAKYTYENALLEVDKIRNSFISQIENNIVSIETDITSLKSTISSLSTSLSASDNSDTQYALTEEKNKNDHIVTINNEINSINNEILSCQSQIADLEDTIENGVIVASCDGTVTLLYDINNGDIIQAGTQLCTIVPLSDALKAVLLIPESDISKISVGDNVEYIISAIPYNEYGRVTGTIISITADSTTVQGQNNKYYLAQAEIPVHVLKNKAGEERSLQTGMLVEGKIICGSKKAILWLLQKMNLRD